MTVLIFKLVGGIGLFIMGMVLLADGIKSFAGDALRNALVRFTGRPVKAFVSGALITSIVQSSSATTVAVIGFVSAGLLTFPQAVGVVLGASLGTTSTGWIVSIFGLKVSIGFYALPLVGIGAFMKLLAHGRWKSFGFALAGFGLIFIGIETLQDGMQGLSGVFNLAELPSTGVFGHLLTILIGLSMTVVMQSSSAAMATTLTALHTNAINFEQAAYLVIGAAIGTTSTGVMATIGASVSTKRTALAHILFNISTGIIAVILLPIFLRAIKWAQENMGLDTGATSLAAFHTSFIAMGVALFLPFIDRFSKLIERLLPEKGAKLTRHLDSSVFNVPAVALEASRRALSEIASEMFRTIQERLGDARKHTNSVYDIELHHALNQSQQFLANIPPIAEDQPLSKARVAQMHTIDHLMRLRFYLHPPAFLRQPITHEHLRMEIAKCREILQLGEAGLRGRIASAWLEMVEKKSLELSEMHHRIRPLIIKQTATGIREPALALDTLDAMRWLDRAGYHAWRVCHYLGGNGQPEIQIEEDN